MLELYYYMVNSMCRSFFCAISHQLMYWDLVLVYIYVNIHPKTHCHVSELRLCEK